MSRDHGKKKLKLKPAQSSPPPFFYFKTGMVGGLDEVSGVVERSMKEETDLCIPKEVLYVWSQV